MNRQSKPANTAAKSSSKHGNGNGFAIRVAALTLGTRTILESKSNQPMKPENIEDLEPFNGHTASQIAYSAFILLGAGLLCLLAGVALGAWIALKRVGL